MNNLSAPSRRGFRLAWIIILAAVLLGGIGWGVVALIRSNQDKPLEPWRTVVSPDKSFRVDMPGVPTLKKQKLPGQTALMTTYFIERGKRSGHVVGYIDLSVKDLEEVDLDQRFDGAKQGMMNSAPTTRVLSEKDITVEDYPGREFELEVPDQVQIVLRVLAVDKRFYLFMAFDPKCRADMPIARRFLDSFEPAPPAGLPPAASADHFFGLVGDWTFNDGIKGDEAPDFTENKLTAKLAGVTSADGVRQKGARFGGPGSFMDLGASPLLNIKEKAGFTIAGWFKPAGLEEQTLVSFRNAEPDKTGFVIKTADRKLWAEITGTDFQGRPRTDKLSTPTPYQKNRWNHFVLMRGPTGVWSLYSNGHQITNDPFNHIPGPLTTTIRRVGEGFHGTLDEICVFETILHHKDLPALAGRVKDWQDSPFRFIPKK